MLGASPQSESAGSVAGIHDGNATDVDGAGDVLSLKRKSPDADSAGAPEFLGHRYQASHQSLAFV